jgi:hypothetical protein
LVMAIRSRASRPAISSPGYAADEGILEVGRRFYAAWLAEDDRRCPPLSRDRRRGRERRAR